MRDRHQTETPAIEAMPQDAGAPRPHLAFCSEDDGSGPPPTERSRQLRDHFGLLSPEDLGALIGVEPRTLAWWRAQKKGPDAVRAGGKAIFYRRTDVDAWLALNVVPMDRVA